MGSAAESLFATLFPGNCRLCNAPLIKISRLPVCDECLASIHPITGGTCVVCGERILSPYASPHASPYVLSPDGPDRSDGKVAENQPRCGLCRRPEPPFARATAYGSYESGLRELIHLLKYEQVRPAANVLGRMLAEAIADLAPAFGDTPLCMVPVPLHRTKLRQRGFNQSELIARAALKLKRANGQLMLNANVLVRQRPTESQIGLTRHQRRENMRGAFSVALPGPIAGREILLVDDVFTTGTTVSECARVLRRNGASKVWVATVARTLKVSATHAGLAEASPTEFRLAAAGSA
jgi:ComF family protein